jgi:hypothetical protein
LLDVSREALAIEAETFRGEVAMAAWLGFGWVSRLVLGCSMSAVIRLMVGG